MNGIKMNEEDSIKIVQDLLTLKNYPTTRTTDKYEHYDLENVEQNFRCEIKCRTLNHQQVLFYNSDGLMLEHIKYQSLSGHNSLFVNVFDTDKGCYIVLWDIKHVNSKEVHSMWCAKSSYDYNTKVEKYYYKLRIQDTRFIYEFKDNKYTKLTFEQFVEQGNVFTNL